MFRNFGGGEILLVLLVVLLLFGAKRLPDALSPDDARQLVEDCASCRRCAVIRDDDGLGADIDPNRTHARDRAHDLGETAGIDMRTLQQRHLHPQSLQRFVNDDWSLRRLQEACAPAADCRHVVKSHG